LLHPISAGNLPFFVDRVKACHARATRFVEEANGSGPNPGGEVHVLGRGLRRLMTGQGLDRDHRRAHGRERQARRVSHHVQLYAPTRWDARSNHGRVDPCVEVPRQRRTLAANVVKLGEMIRSPTCAPPSRARLNELGALERHYLRPALRTRRPAQETMSDAG